jgi:hypothetical protein
MSMFGQRAVRGVSHALRSRPGDSNAPKLSSRAAHPNGLAIRSQRPFRTVRSKMPSVDRRAVSGTIGKRSLMSSPISDQS